MSKFGICVSHGLSVSSFYFLIFFSYGQTDANSFTECYRLEPLDIITNSVHGLSKIIKNRKENAKGKRKRVVYSESNQDQGSNKRGKNIDVHGGLQIQWH